MSIANQTNAYVVNITPAWAAQLLATSPGNRPIRQLHVDTLAGAMRRGEWRVTSQGVATDVNGRLRDGHHRLSACVKSGVAIDTLMIFNTPADAYEVTDCGVNRTASDRLGISKNDAAIYRMCAQIVYATNSLTAAQVKHFVLPEIVEKIELINASCNNPAKYFSSTPMKFAAVITMIRLPQKCAPDYVLSQYKALCLCNIDEMSSSAKNLLKQVNNNSVKARDWKDCFARGLSVFDFSKRNISRIQVSAETINIEMANARTLLSKLAGIKLAVAA